jgi:DNA-binding LacI/PurR family transcriptional regulator
MLGAVRKAAIATPPGERSSARDVARLAGVSTATVSRALNLPSTGDPETLSRVHAAIDKLRYVPHGAARALRSRKSDMIGAVVPSFDYALYARTTSALQREADAVGYALVLAAHGLALDERYVWFGSISLASGRAGMRELLRVRPRPTAVIATNDVFAVGAMLACREARVRVPDDLSITGVDNTDLGATQTPPLTSIQTPVVEVGSAAGVQLVARLEGAPVELQQKLPFTLMKRGSTAKPPAGRSGSRRP